MILIALGANLPSALGPPRLTLEAALKALAEEGVRVVVRSRWYRSAPVPASDQPDFVNAVASVATALGPEELLSALHRVELRFGRTRSRRNEARVLDLDLLAYDERVMEGALTLPHPRLHERPFMLLPLAEIAPGWVHPVLGLSVEALIEALPAERKADVTPCEG